MSARKKAVIALALAAPATSIGVTMAFWIAPGTTLGAACYAAGKIWLYLLPVVWLLMVERGRIEISRPRGGLWLGGVTGLAIAAAILAVAYLIHDRIDLPAMREMLERNHLDQPRVFLAAAIYLSLINSLLEEYAFRWFITTQCRRLMPTLAAVVVSALIFTAHHVIVIRAYVDWPVTLLASSGVFAGGLIWSWLYLRYRSIWPGYVSHIVADAGVFTAGWWLMRAAGP